MNDAILRATVCQAPRVLVAQDDEAMRALMAHALRDDLYEVIEAWVDVGSAPRTVFMSAFQDPGIGYRAERRSRFSISRSIWAECENWCATC
jgi:hypothetical protein